jgi:hypothetical protein
MMRLVRATAPTSSSWMHLRNREARSGGQFHCGASPYESKGGHEVLGSRDARCGRTMRSSTRLACVVDVTIVQPDGAVTLRRSSILRPWNGALRCANGSTWLFDLLAPTYFASFARAFCWVCSFGPTSKRVTRLSPIESPAASLTNSLSRHHRWLCGTRDLISFGRTSIPVLL